MKKRSIYILIGLLLFVGVLTTCILLTKNNKLSNNNKETTTTTKITITDNYDLDLTNKKIITSTSSLDRTVKPDFETMVNYSDDVVIGTITDVEYFINDTNVWTKVTLKVEKNYKNNINSDVIEVVYLGGYISLEDFIKVNEEQDRFADLSEDEISNTIMMETVDQETEFLKTGDRVVMCIAKSSYFEGVYERLSYESMFTYVGGKWIQRNIDNSIELASDDALDVYINSLL